LYMETLSKTQPCEHNCWPQWKAATGCCGVKKIWPYGSGSCYVRSIRDWPASDTVIVNWANNPCVGDEINEVLLTVQVNDLQ